MPKKINIENIIATELEKVEEKVREFQRYLLDNSVSGMASVGGDITLSEDDQDKIHKEITMQIKMMDAVLNWLPLLKKYRETEEQKKPGTYGDQEVGGMFLRK